MQKWLIREKTNTRLGYEISSHHLFRTMLAEKNITTMNKSQISPKTTAAVLFLTLSILMSYHIVSANDPSEKNINRLLNNQVIVSRQIMCVLEKSPCDQLGRQLKGNLFLPSLLVFHLILCVLIKCLCCYSH